MDMVICDAYISLSESSEPDEYYGFKCTLQQLRANHQVACKDSDCSEQIDTSDVSEGDVIYVSEDDESELYQVKVI